MWEAAIITAISKYIEAGGKRGKWIIAYDKDEAVRPESTPSVRNVVLIQKYAWAWWILEFMLSGYGKSLLIRFFFLRLVDPVSAHVEQGYFLSCHHCKPSSRRLG